MPPHSPVVTPARAAAIEAGMMFCAVLAASRNAESARSTSVLERCARQARQPVALAADVAKLTCQLERLLRVLARRLAAAERETMGRVEDSQTLDGGHIRSGRVKGIMKTGCSLVEVTGGEPLLQEEVYPLMQGLLDRGKTVLLETGGHRDTSRVPGDVVTILDIKCPGSGESHRNDWSNLERLRAHDEVKFVVKDRADYEWAREVLHRHALHACCDVLFSPSKSELSPRDLADWIVADRLPVRFQMQLHKLLWNDEPGR